MSEQLVNKSSDDAVLLLSWSLDDVDKQEPMHQLSFRNSAFWNSYHVAKLKGAAWWKLTEERWCRRMRNRMMPTRRMGQRNRDPNPRMTTIRNGQNLLPTKTKQLRHFHPEKVKTMSAERPLKSEEIRKNKRWQKSKKRLVLCSRVDFSCNRPILDCTFIL
jgi:hypothetical protein